MDSSWNVNRLLIIGNGVSCKRICLDLLVSKRYMANSRLHFVDRKRTSFIGRRIAN